ncbi:MAG TPA: PhoH family protein [Planctomycetota bacterium]|nr:PhoH family protein [Planctomycetota bacterium]
MKEITRFQNFDEARAVLGSHDGNLRLIRKVLDVDVVFRNGVVMAEGPDERVQKAVQVLDEIRSRVKIYGRIHQNEVEEILRIIGGSGEEAAEQLPEAERHRIRVFYRDRVIVPKSRGQQEYIEAIRDNDLVFCTGPAGTGKTYLAVAMAVSAVRDGLLRKIILVRPAVEAGEKLGFLPGTMQEKVNPYLRPLYDALNDMMEFGQVQKYIERDIIEVVPLAFMRGRTLNESFIILDEAQNSTAMQMKMFLTRLGVKSKAVVTGDITQIDLPQGDVSGLLDAQRLLRNVPGIAFVALGRADIVRHRLVQAIVDAYEREIAEREKRRSRPSAGTSSGRGQTDETQA